MNAFLKNIIFRRKDHNSIVTIVFFTLTKATLIPNLEHQGIQN